MDDFYNVCVGIGAVIGAVVGFVYAGIGGALLGAILGAVIGMFIPLLFILFLGSCLIGLPILLIKLLWGVFKP